MSVILPHIEQMEAYSLGERPPAGKRIIKLNQNESPYPASPRTLEALRTMSELELRQYPDASCQELRGKLAALHQVHEEQVFIGNGSSEIISLLLKAFVGPEGRVALPDPTFSLYHHAAASLLANAIPVPLKEDWSVDIDGLLQADAQAIIVVNPNAPTGKLLPLADIQRLLQQHTGLLVVDEAYMEFAEPASSAIPLTLESDRVLVIRTFSKAYGLSGVRVGYCIGDAALIGALEKAKDIYNVDAIGRRLAMAAAEDQEHMKRNADSIKRTREAFSKELKKRGFRVVPSQANFVLCAPPEGVGQLRASDWHKKLQDNNIYTRYIKHPRLENYLRISIGTDQEMQQVLDILKQ
jgi:histidinol-phosphate aminotransferase